LLLMVVAIAVVVRVRPLVELDRFGLMGYDQAAYFVGARALTRGYLPYTDFVHIQPPGVLFALAPFSLIGSWGFTVAKLLVVAMGAAGTMLVWRVARPWCGGLAALLAGLAYALSRPSVGAHRYVLIDPFVTVALLAALALHLRHPSLPASAHRATAVGLLLGLAVGFKFSAAVAVAAFAVAMVVVERRRSMLPLVARSFGLGVVAVLGPFLLIAGGSLVRQTVWAQAGRDRSVAVSDRLLSTFWFAGKPPEQHKALAVGVVVLAIVLLVRWGWRSQGFLGALSATWLALGTVFVLVTPQFFEHYGEIV
jgi:4-amino-4-deoxy-L-arabinose transferase-like glycosyltransferase